MRPRRLVLRRHAPSFVHVATDASPIPRRAPACAFHSARACAREVTEPLPLPSSPPTHRRRTPPFSQTRDPYVDVKSLRNTLLAHQEAKYAGIVRKIDQSGHSTRLPGPIRFLDDYGPHPPPASIPPATSARSSENKAWHRAKPRATFKRVVVDQSGVLDEICVVAGVKYPPQGVCADLTDFWRARPGLPPTARLPWLAYLPPSRADGWMSAADRLSAEMRAFDEYDTPTAVERRIADHAIRDVVQAVASVDSTWTAQKIGSRETGLAGPLSDLDITVTSPTVPPTGNEPKPGDTILAALETALRDRQCQARPDARGPALDVVAHRRKGRVPMLMCRHRPSGLHVWIQGTPHACDSTAAVRAAVREYPLLRPLFTVVRQLLVMRGLTADQGGGLTSYPLIHMIVASLKFSEGAVDPADLGQQLLFFLDMYTEIDFASRGISTLPLRYFDKFLWGQGPRPRDGGGGGDDGNPVAEAFARELEGQQRMSRHSATKKWYMTLQDMADPFHNLGRTVHRIRDIQETLIHVRQQLHRAMARWDGAASVAETSGRRGDARPLSVLEAALGGDYRIREHDRRDMQHVDRDPSPTTRPPTSTVSEGEHERTDLAHSTPP